MATVYLARDLRHDRDVALKILRPELAGALGRERFIREIRLAASLTHPHILPLHDSGDADGSLYFVMPVVQGLTLRERLRAEGCLQVESAVRIASEVADALDYAHRRDVVHRDIKPENILLHEGHAMVADFGIGKAIAFAAGDNPTFTQVGMTVGTPAYMSPEQASGDVVDGRSDLFALGCVMYEMLTGEAAFTGVSIPAVIASRFVHTPPAVTEHRREVPAALAAIVTRLLEKEPADRYANGALVAEALRNLSVSPQPAPPAAPPDGSIAVLPFVNMSADADNEFFSDGLTEELLTDLSRVQALRVTSRTSSMQYKGSTLDAREIGRVLGVRYVLTGSVRRAGNSLRIAAQLVDAPSDRQLWGEKYSGTMDDVFDVQERVSREIVAALGITLDADEDRRFSARGIRHVEAYDLYLEAREELRRLSLTTNRWESLLDRAIAIEGEIPVLLGLRVWGQVSRLKAGIGDPAVLDAVERQARELVVSAPDGPWGYAALGYAAFERGDMLNAIAWFRQSIARDPSDTSSRFFLSVACSYAGLVTLSGQVSARMVEVDPLAPLSWMAVAISPWFAGRLEGSFEPLRKALAIDPQNFFIRWSLGYAFTTIGDLAAAQAEIDWMRAAAPQIPYCLQADALLRAVRGDIAGALALVGPLDLTPFDCHLTFHFAEVFALAGEIERGMEVVELAVQKGFSPPDFIRTHCRFIEPLRSHPRFPLLVAAAEAKSEAVRRAVDVMPTSLAKPGEN